MTDRHRSTGTASPLRLNGLGLLADPSGALVWPERRTVVVADLHLEKGSSFARRGLMLPPYDTAATLDRLAEVLGRYEARQVICLGDSFHDRAAHDRLRPFDRMRLLEMTSRHDWTWIAGNHDPAPDPALGGTVVRDAFSTGPLVFRHIARRGASPGEVSGHFHPKATLSTAVKRVAGRCFVADGQRLVLPAFGAFAGGLDVFAPPLAALFPQRFQVHLIAGARTIVVPSDRLCR